MDTKDIDRKIDEAAEQAKKLAAKLQDTRDQAATKLVQTAHKGEHRLSETVERVAHRVQEAAHRVAHRAQETANALSGEAKQFVSRIEHGSPVDAAAAQPPKPESDGVKP
jgi:hypothetical protein